MSPAEPSRRAADPRRALGDRGEGVAACWYTERGYVILDRQWRCRDGELDLVLAGSGCTVFCEVKSRTSAAFGVPAEAVNLAKQRRIRRLAARWLAEHPAHRGELRFDVAAVTFERGRTPVTEIIENAF